MSAHTHTFAYANIKMFVLVSLFVSFSLFLIFYLKSSFSFPFIPILHHLLFPSFSYSSSLSSSLLFSSSFILTLIFFLFHPHSYFLPLSSSLLFSYSFTQTYSPFFTLDQTHTHTHTHTHNNAYKAAVKAAWTCDIFNIENFIALENKTYFTTLTLFYFFIFKKHNKITKCSWNPVWKKKKTCLGNISTLFSMPCTGVSLC